MSHGERPKYPLPTVEDHDDLKTRMELTDKFNAIYDREWRMAYSELYDQLRWKDADCIYSLMRVVRVGFLQMPHSSRNIYLPWKGAVRLIKSSNSI